MKKIYSLIVCAFIIINANAQLTYTEGFEGSTFPAAGWVITNLSSPTGPSTWRQADSILTVDGTTSGFSPFAGSKFSFASYGSTGLTGTTNTISNWFLTPVLKLRDGASFSFYTRTYTGSQYPDRLQIRLSINGSSTNVGATATSVGDFTTLVCDLNPNLETAAGTTCGAGYPQAWQQYTFTLSGLGTTCINGRLAFRYFVTAGGAQGDNSFGIGIDNFSYTTPAACVQALPVSLSSFTASVKNNTNILNWSTATETNNKGFEVMKSFDGNNFETVGTVVGKGNNSSVSNYEWVDNKPFATSYYKLKQIDNDGKFQYSNVVSVKQNSINQLNLVLKQNPVQTSLAFVYDLPQAGNVSISVKDVFGRTIYSNATNNVAAGLHNFSTSTLGYAKGSYFIQLSSNGSTLTKQFIVQ